MALTDIFSAVTPLENYATGLANPPGSLASQMSVGNQMQAAVDLANNPDNFIPGFTQQTQALQSSIDDQVSNYVYNLGGMEAVQNSPAVMQQVQSYINSLPEVAQLNELQNNLQSNNAYQQAVADVQNLGGQVQAGGANQLGGQGDYFTQPIIPGEQPVNNIVDPGFTDVGYIGGRAILTPGEEDYIPGIVDLARGLVTQDINLPEQQLAGFTPAQLEAFQMAREGIGAYEPFLGAATDLTGLASTGLQQNLAATRLLAGQIPGQVEAGQAALSKAAQDLQNFAAQGAASAEEAAANILAAAQSSDPATKLAAEELMASSSRLGELASRTEQRLLEAGVQAQDVASIAAQNARALQAPLQADLAASTTGARGLASLGQTGADVAAERARMSTAEAQAALQAASQFGQQAAEQGIAGLAGSAAMYDPTLSRGFMSEYEDAAVQQALADIARQGELQERQLEAEAVQAGAFGGSRQAIAEAELQRNILEQQGRTAAQMRAAGFESAAERAQTAYEQALARQQQAAQLTGQLGQMGAASAAQAAQAGGQLGLSAEELAQASALQGAQLGMSAEQFASANAQAMAQTGLSIEQLAAQTGMNAAELAGQFAAQAGQMGLSAEQQRQAAAAQQAQLAQAQAQLGMQGAQAAGEMNMAGAQMQMQGAQAAGDLGLQGANLGLAGIQAGLGAQQQAAGLNQGIAGLAGQYMGIGQAQQQMSLQDINTMLGIGGQQQRQTQGAMDVLYQNQYTQAMQPYQQLAYYSDIAQGTPSGQSSVTTMPGPSTGSQLLGAAMAIPAIYSGFQSMSG